jgi:bifunctional DNA-binding transcriptional regulator/antitoxin component of YhaV-PrlF toxin-antitoxin module
MSFTATITSKGQLTIPREARKVLDSNTVEIDVVGETVVLRPVHSVAGALAKYAGRKKSSSMNEVREKVWREVAGEKK